MTKLRKGSIGKKKKKHIGTSDVNIYNNEKLENPHLHYNNWKIINDGIANMESQKNK